MRKKTIAAAAVVVTALGVLLTGCATMQESDSHVVSENLSKESEQFRVPRDIVFYNGITDKYIAEVKGYCSVDTQSGLPGKTLAVTCAVGPNAYTKDYLGLSDNVSWFMRQMQTVNVSRYHKEIILKPENVVPDIRFEGGVQ